MSTTKGIREGARVRMVNSFNYFLTSNGGGVRPGTLGTVTRGAFGLYTDPSKRLLCVKWDGYGIQGTRIKDLELVTS